MRPEAQRQINKLLHNKSVVVLGDSIQRSVYKDLVLMLQRESYLSLAQLKSKGEFTFEGDYLVEGGRMGKMNNGTAYREVRQYRTGHHLVRFYFVTQVFSTYMESILKDFEVGIKPDLVIVNSCVWDVSRYKRDWASEYRENLLKFFRRIKSVLPEESLVVWNMTMPLGKKIIGGFLVPEIQHMGPMLRFDVIEANYFGATLASQFGFDVLDLHFQFRFSLQHRMADGVHWNAVAHRSITSLLLEHIAEAWGVEMPKLELPNPPKQMNHNRQMATSALPAHSEGPYSNERFCNPHQTPSFHYNTVPAWMQSKGMQQFGGFGLQSGVFNLQSGRFGFQSGGCNLQSSRFGFQSGGCNLQSSRFGFQSGGCNLQSGRFGFQSGAFGPQSGRFGFQSGAFGLQAGRFGGFNLQSGGFGLQSGGFDAQFCSDNIPPHLTVGYHSFERESLYRAGNRSAAAPSCPVKMVKKQKHRRHNPYTREKPRSNKY